MSFRELRERQLAEKWNPMRDAVATIVAEIRNSVSTDKVWTVEELLTDRLTLDDDDEDGDYEPQTAEELRAVFAWAGAVVTDGNDH